MRLFCFAPNPINTALSGEVTAKPPARHINANTPMLTPMKIIVNGFERVNRVCRNRLSEAALYSAATASIEPNPQWAHSGFWGGVGLLQAGQVRNPESLTVCSKNRLVPCVRASPDATVSFTDRIVFC